MKCPRLEAADLADLAGLRRALRDAQAVSLGQAWRPQPDPALRPGRVRAGFHGEALVVLAELEDDDIFTRATAFNQRFWELGDTFEIFLEPRDAKEYLEVHVAPNNLHLQLRIPIPRPPDEEPEEQMIGGDLFQSRVHLEPGRWIVAAEVPFETIGGVPARFSFSRYDYTRGRAEPVHSSTSPHPEFNFHRRQEWGTLEPA